MRHLTAILCLTFAVLLGSAGEVNAGKFDKYEKQIKMKTLTCYNDEFKKYVFSTDGNKLYVNNKLQPEHHSYGVEKQKGKLVFLWTQTSGSTFPSWEHYINFEKQIVIKDFNPTKVKNFKSYTMNYTCS